MPPHVTRGSADGCCDRQQARPEQAAPPSPLVATAPPASASGSVGTRPLVQESCTVQSDSCHKQCVGCHGQSDGCQGQSSEPHKALPSCGLTHKHGVRRMTTHQHHHDHSASVSASKGHIHVPPPPQPPRPSHAPCSDLASKGHVHFPPTPTSPRPPLAPCSDLGTAGHGQLPPQDATHAYRWQQMVDHVAM